MYKFFSVIRNYYLQARVFGFSGFFRTIIGTLSFHLDRSSRYQNSQNKKIALITFSINPVFSQVWACFAKRFIDQNLVDIFIVDSSGNLKPEMVEGVTVVHYVNTEHGKKINRFARKLNYPFIWLCDDDVFFSDHSTMQVVKSHIDKDRLFAISLMPREQKVKNHHIEQQAMGSYCVCFSRDVFIRERLSFRPFATNNKEINWGRGYFDTADYAHQQAIDRNYQVVIAKSESLQAFMGTSIVYLKFNMRERSSAAFLEETIRISDDWRRIAGRLGSAFCVNKIYRLFTMIQGVTPDWQPPIHEDQIVDFASGLSNIQAKERSQDYFKKYSQAYEKLSSLITSPK